MPPDPPKVQCAPPLLIHFRIASANVIMFMFHVFNIPEKLNQQFTFICAITGAIFMWVACFRMGAYKHDVVVVNKVGAYIHGVLILCGCLYHDFTVY